MCANPGVRKVIDGNLDEGMTGAGVSRAMAALGLQISADVVRSHRQHYKPEPTRPPHTRKHDFAVYMRDRMAAAVENLQPDVREDGTVGMDPILHKDFAPALNTGLKAQAIIDKREQQAKKTTQAETLLALLSALRGEGRPTLLLDDPNIIEGEVVDVTPD